MSTGGIQLTQEQFCKDIYDLYGSDYSIVSEYKGLRNKVLIKHNKCGNVFEKNAGNIRRKNGVLRCPCEINKGHRVTFDKNINSIAVVDTEFAKLFLNPDDTWKYTCNSAKRSDFLCPNCGNIIKNKMIYDVHLNGLKCSCRNNGMSIAEKFVYTLLNMKSNVLDGNTFLYDKTTEWSCGKRYDFIFSIKGTMYIVETHGLQHYEQSKLFIRSLDEEKANDLYKKNLALDNDVLEVNYIVIDCRKSDIDFIKDNVLNSRLKDVFELQNFNWDECISALTQSLITYSCELYNSGYKTKEIAQMTGLHQGTVSKYLNTGTQLGLCKFEDSHKKKVKCKNTGVIYNSITDALKNYGLKRIYLISDVCQGKREYCLNPINKEKLYWEYA